MANKAEYRSAIRSRRLIREAFLSLLKEKEYRKITVTDIVTRADLNRATFYAHYPDVAGLMEAFESEVLSKLAEVVSHVTLDGLTKDPMPLLKETNRYLEENLDFCRTLIRSNASDLFLEKLKETFISFMLNATQLPSDLRHSQSFQLRMQFYAGGAVDMYRQWLLGNLNHSLDTLAEEISRITLALIE